MEEIKQTFFKECEEQLVELETGLLSMEGGDQDPDTINAVFRAVHSIKGGAGAFGLDALVRFAHAFETILEAVRSNRLAPEPPVVRVFLAAADLLNDLVRDAQGGQSTANGRSAALEAELASLTSVPAVTEDLAPEWDALLDFQPVSIDASRLDDPITVVPAAQCWRVTFRPRASLFATGNDPVVLLRELARLGQAQTTLDLSRLPRLDALDPEAAYLAWTIKLTATCAEQDVRDVFEFVDTDCDLLIELAPTETVPLLVETEAKLASPPLPPPPPEASRRPDPATPSRPTIRVDLDRLDRLIDLVGELVINQAVLAQRMTEAGFNRASGVAVGLEELESLTREIQDSVMAIRAQPVKAVFQRLPRLAREVATLTGKEIRLITEGENTEVDNTVIERLSDPLTHMIRNAIDHGIESPERRIAVGKPPEGTIRIAALHRSGRIVIEVTDDGAGIDRDRVLASAVAKGLVATDAILSDDDIDNLIFAPGFSTAETISDISGRGVGMDVVRRSIQALGGRISIMSQPGRGSTFSLSLPLTLAVLDGMVVGVGEGRFVVPLTTILETFQPSAVRVHRLSDGIEVASIRGSFVPLIDVGVALGFRTGHPDPANSVALLVEAEDGRRAALVVDVIHGQRQVVIKSLEANYRHVPGVAAATILGDGHVALILDVTSIVVDPGPIAQSRELVDA